MRRAGQHQSEELSKLRGKGPEENVTFHMAGTDRDYLRGLVRHSVTEHHDQQYIPHQHGNEALELLQVRPPEHPHPAPSWRTQTSQDEMTGKSSAYAVSPRVRPKSPMEFPYSDTQAWLAVGCDNDSEWAYFGFTNAPNLNNTDTEDGYNVVRTRVRWNDTVQTTAFTQKWGDSFLHFRDYGAAIAKIAGSSSVMLELDWHGQRPVHFEVSLNGSSKAIQDMRSKCR